MAKRESKKVKIIKRVLDVVIVLGFFGCIFANGRLYQHKIDKETLEKQQQIYFDLVEEYKNYRANSYVLHG